MSVGKRIRALRQQLGLSQQQLAGKEMTRAFISQVESGRCNPSPATLRIIAARLGTTVEYLVSEEPAGHEAEMTLALLQRAQDLLEQPQPENKSNLTAAHRILQRALPLALASKQRDLEARVRSLLARTLAHQHEYDRAAEEYERALECFQALQDTQGMAETYLALGNLFYHLEDFTRAKRMYERVLVYTNGMKGRLEMHVDALTYLGTVHFRLGDRATALHNFREAYQEALPLDDAFRLGQAARGAGLMYHLLGDHESAYTWTNRAIAQLQRCNSQDLVLAKHNLAIVESARGNWERMYVILQECLSVYRYQGRVKSEAAALEELARYWIHKGDLSKAEEICWQALERLDMMDNTALRGRFYRFLSLLAESQGRFRDAYTFARMSYDLLRRIKASAEVEETKRVMDRLRDRLQEEGMREGSSSG